MTPTKCMLTGNACYQAGHMIRPVGVMIHSTGANNPTLRRYVQPALNDPDRERLLNLLGENKNGNDWNNTKRQVCVHAFIGRLADGTVAAVQTLPWDMRGWHAGDGKKGSANDTHIAFEICEDGLEDAAYFREVYRAAVELTAMLCRKFGLNPLADGVVICHSEGYQRGIASNHGDVTHWFPRHGKTMEDFRTDTAAELKNDSEAERIAALITEYRKSLQDNDAAAYSAEARRWAVEQGIVQGGSGDEFNGMWEDFLTREQAVVILFRFWDKLLKHELDGFRNDAEEYG